MRAALCLLLCFPLLNCTGDKMSPPVPEHDTYSLLEESEEVGPLPAQGPESIGIMSLMHGETPRSSFEEEQIRKYSPENPGVYRIYWGDETYYAGTSENIREALLEHFEGNSIQSECIWRSIRMDGTMYGGANPHFYYEQIHEERERGKKVRAWGRKYAPGCEE